MSGVGSTNAMKKGSANNPFLAYSEADMQGFLNSAYTGCIVKYAGPSTKIAVPRGQKLSLGDAQNLVVDLTKNFTYSPVSYKSREWNIGIEIENSDNTKTNQCIMNIKIDSKTGIIGSGNNDIQALIYSEYTPHSSLYGKNINEISVKFLAVTSVNVDRDVVVNWPITYGKNGWQSDCFNDLGKITLWGYGETVLAYQNQNNIDYWDNGDVIYTEPYIVNELYKVVYGDGQYYFEEFYYISENVTTATVEDVAPGKTFYDFTGTKQTGTGSKINPYIASTADEMAAYLTSSYKGAFVKYIGETVTVGGTPVPVNPIAVGDILQSTTADGQGHPILYLNTNVTPDFSQFPDEQMQNEGGYSLFDVLEGSSPSPFLTAHKMSQGSDTVYALGIGMSVVYAFSETMSPSTMGLEHWGWVYSSPFTEERWSGDVEVSSVNQQDIWGAYISKDGQWTSGGGESYVKNAIYQVAEDGDTTMYVILPTLSNPGTAADLAQGKQLIDGEGKVVEGEAVNPEGKLAMDLFAKTITDINDTQGSITSWPAMYYSNQSYRAAFCTNCKQLSRVNLPNLSSGSGAIIPSMAFYGCTNLKYVDVGYFNRILSSAFYGCSNLREIKGLENITYIADSAFINAKFVQDDEFVLPKFSKLPDINAYYVFRGAELFDITDETFPALTYISGYSAFYNTKNITKLSLTNLETLSGYYAFTACQDLQEINCPKLLRIFGQDCFRGCHKLSSVNIPLVSFIGSGAFGGCSLIKYISLPAVTTLSSEAFGYCTFSKIVLPSLSKINNDPFYNCRALVSVYLPNSIVCSATANMFSYTPMRSLYSEAGYKYGSIYVPMSLLSQYQSAPYWSNLSSRIVGLTDEEFASVLT